jgi:hypothetical protein
MPNGEDLLEKLREIKTKDNTLTKKRNKATAGAAILGAASGALLAINRGYNLLTASVTGAIVFGMIAHLILPKNEEEDDD